MILIAEMFMSHEKLETHFSCEDFCGTCSGLFGRQDVVLRLDLGLGLGLG